MLHGSKASGSFVLFQTKDRELDDPPARPSGPDRSVPDFHQADAGDGRSPARATAREWAFEVKWDGVRAILFVEGGRVRAQSRNDLDVTAAFPELADIGEFLGMTTCVLDGEIVALGDDGRPSFARLQHRLHVAEPAGRRSAGSPGPGHVRRLRRPLPRRPFAPRPSATTSDAAPSSRCISRARRSSRPTRSATSRVRTSSTATVQNGLEGVVAKRRASPYRPGRRHPDWVKVKTFRTQEVVIGGWTEGHGDRQGSLGALLLGIPEDGGLRYVGKVGTGFSADHERRPCSTTSRRLTTPDSPFVSALPGREAVEAHFVRPELVGEVEFSEWTTAGRLRHPTWRGLRPDKALTRSSSSGGRCSPGAAGGAAPVSTARSSTRTTIERPRALRLQPREGPVPALRLHQGTAHRLLRPGRSGDAAPHRATGR